MGRLQVRPTIKALQEDKCWGVARARSSSPITTRRAFARRKSKPSSCPKPSLEPASCGLQVLRCEEDSPRVAYVQLTPELAFVTFPAGSEPLPVWRGREMQAGDIMFHSRGEWLHQSTPGHSV